MRTPITIRGIDHLLLLVSGMDEAVAFYGGVLGCPILARLPEYGMVEFGAGAATIDLVDIESAEGAWARPEIGGGRNMDHVCLALGADDDAALRRHLAASGVAILEEQLHEDAGGARLSLYVRDPSGNTIELKAPPKRR